MAQEKDYQCIYPGDDPNPVDIGIQMHLIQFFHHFAKLKEAEDLCRHVASGMAKAQYWVYYTVLIPLMRESDLVRIGCHVTVPESVLSATPDRQRMWVDLLQSLSAPRNDVNKRRAQALLSRIANDSFARLRRDPPLLYHNDATATPPRFYWSDMFGYALWLRVYYDFSDKITG